MTFIVSSRQDFMDAKDVDTLHTHGILVYISLSTKYRTTTMLDLFAKMIRVLNWLLLIVVSFSLLLCSGAVVYYIAPYRVANETCSDGGNTTLRPCYSLQQMSNGANDGLLLNKSGTIMLLLLPGIHLLPENHTLKLFNVSEVQISSWTQNQNQAKLECHSEAYILLQEIDRLNIFSLNFSSCSILLFSTAQVEIDDCVFAESKADYPVVIRTSNNQFKINIWIMNCKFDSNDGAVSALPMGSTSSILKTNNITISGTFFLNNQGSKVTVDAKGVNLNIHGSFFINNTVHGSGGAISTFSSNTFIAYTLFLNNYATRSGGAILQFLASQTIYACIFSNNSAGKLGGAIYSQAPVEFIVQNTDFIQNTANASGGSVYVQLNRTPGQLVKFDACHFENNSATFSGGAFHLLVDSNKPVDLGITNCTFDSNQAGVDGGGVYCKKLDRASDLNFYGGHSQLNSATNGGFLYLSNCSALMKADYTMFGNRAKYGGAIYADRSEIFKFESRNVFLIQNTAEERGDAIFAVNSYISIPSYDYQLNFSRNRVTSPSGEGGAIYIRDSNCESILSSDGVCSIGAKLFVEKSLTSIVLLNNSAAHGPDLYGGLLDRCERPLNFIILNGVDYFEEISQYKHTPLAITSDAVKVCFCPDSLQPNCTLREMQATKMRGETVEVSVTSVDQYSNPVPSVVRANYESTTADLGEGEGRNSLPNNCTMLRYHIFTVDTSAKLVLQPEGYCERSPLSNLAIDVEIMNCSRGFEQNVDTCDCDRRLKLYLNITECLVDNHTLVRNDPIWLKYDKQQLKMAKHCPLDYCQVTNDTISISSPDEQCAHHRSGVLCGGCPHNYSIALGGSKCLPCTDKYSFIWLVLVFAVAGVVLVAFLLACNMTISHGTLNGLIFYANVISTSGLTNLQNCSLHPILSVFIAWVNLDLGVETCFYPGMDTYQKTWLQFAFPLYIILLVIAILVASYYSSTAMKVFGRNNISLLATLFLLSYSKALKTIISAVSATQVLASAADNVSAPVLPYTVWSYDGNVEYLKGKHVALFTVALVFLLVLFLPYTLLLTFGQCLRSLPVRGRWISRLTRSTAFVSIMDAYHAPYNRRHRYWTGLMLLTRCVLFLAFATNFSNSDKVVINSFISSIVISGVLLIKTFTTQVYGCTWLNLLEISFLCNLEVLSVTLCYLKASGYHDIMVCTATNISISISFVIFVGIVIYHACLQIRASKWYSSIKQAVQSRLPMQQYQAVSTDKEVEEQAGPSGATTGKLPTTSHINFREVLLESD